MVHHRFRNSVTSSKAFPGADCGNDHVPVINEIRVKLKKLRKIMKNPKLQVHLPKTDLKMKENFRIEVQNRFEALNRITEPELLWKQLKSTIISSAEKVLPKAQDNKKTKWMTDDILKLMEQRRLKKLNPLEYNSINKQIKKKCSEAKEKWLNEQCSEIENKLNVNTKYVHEKINEIAGKSRCTYLNQKMGLFSWKKKRY